MADLYADVQGPLENPDLIALGTVLSGAGVAFGGALVAQATWMRDAGNYGVASAYDDMIAPLFLLGLLFWLGCYLGASAFWIASEREADIVPLRVAIGAVMIGLLGFGLMLLLGSLLPIGRPVAASGTLLAAYYGARFTTVLRRKKPMRRGLRVGRTALSASVLLLATVLVTYKPHGFPATGTLADRHAWAGRAFGEHYPIALEYVKGCPEVTARLGAVTAIAPAPGTNVVYEGQNETVGDFTLEVVGQADDALVHARVARVESGKDSATYERSGELLSGARALPLDCR